MSKKKRPQKIIKQATGFGKEADETLATLVSKRNGGSINIRGIEFQLLYAVHLILTMLKEGASDSIRLEGIEDIDLYLENSSEFIQAKTSQNKMDANSLWELGAVQNFLKVYRLAPNSNFRFVHNCDFAKGMIQELVSKKYSDQGIQFWADKFNSIGGVEDIKGFLNRITFERNDIGTLKVQIQKSLIQYYNVNSGSELPFLRALFYNVFEWSKQRTTVVHNDVLKLMQSVKDSFSGFAENPALKHKWIRSVQFEPTDGLDDLSYYDGKAARPSDISRGLPIKRPIWETEINKSVSIFDVTVIRSSSGQGKSTLAWVASMTASKSNSSVYQIVSCSTRDQAVATLDFIESRLIIGEFPLVVVDGISQETSSWHALAEALKSKPVKVIITTREEDWARYGDANNIELNVIDIRLSMSEAKEIFTGLRINNRLHSSTASWEPAWEKVKDKGLLIEYVYLLTQGQMIEQRLNQQVRTLSNERDSPAKIEILRLISLADVLNIRILTQKLTESIIGRYTLTTDRNELYRQLEREYYLKFGTKYVEGLHPVRSSHLVNILHSHIDVSTSLLDLLKIVEDEYIYEYFISAPLQFHLDEDFYKEAAALMSSRPFSQMVYVIDGLMHSEPFHYWQKNKQVFDQIYQRGGLELAVYDTVPIGKLNTVENLANTMGELGENLRHIAGLLRNLSLYDFKESAVFRFTKHLQLALTQRQKTTRFEGVAFLYRWFKTVALNFPDVIEIDRTSLMKFLELHEIDESSEVFSFFYLHQPEFYRKFLEDNKSEMIAIIKRKTNTLTIEEDGTDVHINYLLDNDVHKINENSVYRINIVRAFFPDYNRYCTEAIILPFPNEATIRAAHQMSIKTIQPQNLSDEFNVHVNKIWAKVILDQYAASSLFEWQKFHLELREKMMELARKCLRILEAKLENDISRLSSLIREVNQLGNDYLNMDAARKKYPPQSRKYFDKNIFETQEKAISEFRAPFRNFVNQFFGLLMPKTDQESHLPVVNIKDAASHLIAMQNGYEEIIDTGHKYFSTDDIKKHELITIPRLAKVASFYAGRVKKGLTDRIVAADQAANAWSKNEETKLINQIKEVIDKAGDDIMWHFTLPVNVLEISSVKYVTIGVQGFDITSDDDLWALSVALTDLANIGIHFFIILVADDEKNIIGAFRLSQQYFEKMRDGIAGFDIDDNWSIPLPVDIKDPTVQMPSGFQERKLQLKGDENYFKMMFNIWKLNEYRSRLNYQSTTELAWLAEIELEYQGLIREDFKRASTAPGLMHPDSKMIDDFLDNEIEMTNGEIVQLMLERVQAVSLRQFGS